MRAVTADEGEQLMERLGRVMYRCRCFPGGTRNQDLGDCPPICEECVADRALIRQIVCSSLPTLYIAVTRP